jgi:myo-inositol-1(or 4)-monophosphatase
MSKELDVVVEAAKEAGKILLKNFGKPITAKYKTEIELVTEIDVECEKKILSILKRDFPDYSVWAEESGQENNDSDYRWIIDPLDGTHNYFYGLPLFGVSIALAKKDKSELGAILLPISNELFTVERGKGAFLNGKPIKVSKRQPSESLVNICSSLLYSKEGGEMLKGLKDFVFSTRALESAVIHLSGVACGRIDALIEGNEKLGDYGVGHLLVEEAGGRVSNFDGTDFSWGNPRYLASSGVFHDKLVELMRDLNV